MPVVEKKVEKLLVADKEARIMKRIRGMRVCFFSSFCIDFCVLRKTGGKKLQNDEK